MYLPSGFLDWRRNLKALMFIHKSSCEETNLPQQNCFSRFFVCLKSAFVFYYFDYLPCALVNNENTETFTTAKLIAKLIAQKWLAPFLRHVYTICLMRKQTSTGVTGVTHISLWSPIYMLFIYWSNDFNNLWAVIMLWKVLHKANGSISWTHNANNWECVTSHFCASGL